MKYLILIMVCFTFSNCALAECYLCTEEKVTGFVYLEKTKEWVQANLKGSQFLLKPLKPSDKTGEEEYGVYEAKNGTLLFRCNYWFADLGIAHCGNNNLYHFKFMRGKNGTGKFVSVDVGAGYFFKHDKTSVPRIGIGSCIQID